MSNYLGIFKRDREWERERERKLIVPTCMTLIGRLVSLANCSRMCLVGLGVCENAVFSISNCFALIVVLGPRLFEPELPSSGDLFSVWLSLVSGSPSNEPVSTDHNDKSTITTITRERVPLLFFFFLPFLRVLLPLYALTLVFGIFLEVQSRVRGLQVAGRQRVVVGFGRGRRQYRTRARPVQPRDQMVFGGRYAVRRGLVVFLVFRTRIR